MKRVFCVAMFGCVVACGGKAAESAPPAAPEAHDEHHAHGTTTGGPVKAPGEANVGDTTKCPVSGEEFVVDATSPKAEYNSKTYYFCCSGCKKKFESSPEKFLGKS